MHSGGTQLYIVNSHVMIADCECSLVETMYCVFVCVFLYALNERWLVSPMVLNKIVEAGASWQNHFFGVIELQRTQLVM